MVEKLGHSLAITQIAFIFSMKIGLLFRGL